MSTYSNNNVRIKYTKEKMGNTDTVRVTELSSVKYAVQIFDPFGCSNAGCSKVNFQLTSKHYAVIYMSTEYMYIFSRLTVKCAYKYRQTLSYYMQCT